LIHNISLLEAYILSCITYIWYKPSPVNFLSVPATDMLFVED